MNFPIVDLNPQIPEWIERIPEIGDNIEFEINNTLHPNLHFLSGWDYLNNTGNVEKMEDGKDHINLYQPFCQFLWSIGFYLSLFFDIHIHAPL